MEAAAVSEPGAGVVGRIFNLQRCSVHDGPGIRTTVFLKGCPLSCAWCHNPEGIDPEPELMLDRERCLGCGACREPCPLPEGGAAPPDEPWDAARCLRCGSCVAACPTGARTLAGRSYGVDELVELLARDRPFFEASGGGITFSGGEPLSQPGFLAACIRRCRSLGLHTAVDTCGAAARGTVLEIAALSDLVLYDLKLMDAEAHLRHTGTVNHAILDNLRALSAGTTELRVRVPLVPGINDGAANLEAMAAFLKSLPRRHPVDVLPYHRAAAAKTARLAAGRSFSGFEVPGPGALAAARAWFERVGLETTIGGSP